MKFLRSILWVPMALGIIVSIAALANLSLRFPTEFSNVVDLYVRLAELTVGQPAQFVIDKLHPSISGAASSIIPDNYYLLLPASLIMSLSYGRGITALNQGRELHNAPSWYIWPALVLMGFSLLSFGLWVTALFESIRSREAMNWFLASTLVIFSQFLVAGMLLWWNAEEIGHLIAATR